MTYQRFHSQRGISFFGLLIVGVLLALLAIVGARVLPTATEFMAIQKAAKKAAAEKKRQEEKTKEEDKAQKLGDASALPLQLRQSR